MGECISICKFALVSESNSAFV